MAVDQREQEIETLRARVAELERQLAEQAARTNRAVAAAQDRAYWLDRWHLDLNAVMERRGADEFRAFLRFARTVAYRLRRLRDKLPI